MPIRDLENLGPKTEERLAAIGVFTKADIERIGSVGIYRLLRSNGIPASLNLVYALEAMLIGVHWTKIPASLKIELKNAVRDLNL